MERFLDLHSSRVPVHDCGLSKDRMEFLENPSANGQNHSHDNANNRDIGKTVGNLCKPFPCTFHRVLHDLGYHVIKYRVKDLQHSKPPVPSVWCSQVGTNSCKALVCSPGEIHPEPGTCNRGECHSQSEVNNLRNGDFPIFCHPFLPILLHKYLRQNVTHVHPKAGEHFLGECRGSNSSLTSPTVAFGNNDITTEIGDHSIFLYWLGSNLASSKRTEPRDERNLAYIKDFSRV